jgi:acetoacetate decarboxylase
MTSAFAAPVHPIGSLYGPPPWRFAGRSLTVIAQCDPAAIAALVPAPLQPWGDLVRFSVHALQCDLGFGWDFAQANPHRSQFHEAVIGIAVEHEGRVGHWDPFLWTDGDAELAVGREMYGWPQRLGTMALTMPHPVRGFVAGDTVAGRVARLTEPVFTCAVTLQREGELDAPQPPFVGFYTERALPDPAARRMVRELFFSRMEEVQISDLRSGPAELALHAPEITALRPLRVLGGKAHAVSWVKDSSVLLSRAEAPFPAR